MNADLGRLKRQLLLMGAWVTHMLKSENSPLNNLVGRIVYLLLRGFFEVVAVRRTHHNRNPLIRNVIIA